MKESNKEGRKAGSPVPDLIGWKFVHFPTRSLPASQRWLLSQKFRFLHSFFPDSKICVTSERGKCGNNRPLHELSVLCGEK